MNIHIIGILKDSLNNITGYRLIDLDDNNKTLDVPKSSLLTVLKAKKLKVNNVKLYGNSITGVHYSLQKLPIITEFNCEYHKLIVLQCINNRDYLVANCLGKTRQMTTDEFKETIRNNFIINLDNEGKPLCKKINIVNDNTILLKKLELEARDKTKIWDIKTFDTYMKLKGWTYKLQDTLSKNEVQVSEVINGTYPRVSIKNVSTECNVLHLPIEVSQSDNLYDKLPTNIDTIIFGPNFYRIYKLASISLDTKCNIKGMYFQSDGIKTNSFVGSGLENCYIEELELPKYNTIKESFNNCTIKKLEITSKTDLVNSFNNLSLLNNNLDTMNIEEIATSFNDLRVNNIIINSELTNCKNSFNKSTVENLDFSKANKLSMISTSFKKLVNIKRIDFSNANRLVAMNMESFSCCHELEEVILPNSLRALGKNFASNSKVKSIELPDNIYIINYPIGNEDTVVYYPETITKITKELITNLSTENKIVFKGTITSIGREIHSGMGDINIPNTVINLDESALSRSNFLEFNFNDYKNIKYIPPKTLSLCYSLELVNFGDYVTEIDEFVLKGNYNMTKIVIGPNTTKIHKNAFKDISTYNIPTFYVIENTYAHNYVKNNNFIYKLINSTDDIINIEKASDKIKAKYKIMLKDSEYECLLQEPYINYVNILYKIFNDYNKKIQTPSNELDTSKFINLEVNKFTNLNNRINTLHNVVTTSKKNPFEFTENVFIGLCNLITTLFDNCGYCYTDSYIDYMNTIGNGILDRMLYIDENKSILVMETSNKNKKSKIRVLMIIIDNNVVFQIPIDESVVKTHDIKVKADSFIRVHAYKSTFAGSLETGDSINNLDERLNGIPLPRDFSDTVLKNLKETLTYIGTLSSKAYRKNKKALSLFHKVLYYNANCQKFIEAYAKVTNINVLAELAEFSELKIINTYDINEIHKIDKEYLKEFIGMGNSQEMLNKVKLASLNKEEINNIFNNINNYDCDGNIDIVEAAKICYANNIKNKAELTVELFNSIVKTGLIQPIKKSINYFKKDNLEESLAPIYNSSENFILEYKVTMLNKLSSSNKSNVFGIIKPEDSLSNTKLLYYSELDLNNIIRILYSIGSYIENNKLELPKCSIDNNKINIDEYMCISTLVDTKYFNCKFKYNLALNKLNADAYIIGEVHDTDFYKLFRFKDYESAKEFLYTQHRDTQLLREIMDYLVYNSNEEPSNNDLFDIRSFILKGIPNNYPINTADNELFSKLAKQPKI